MKIHYLLQIIKKGLKIQKSIIIISTVVITRRTHFVHTDFLPLSLLTSLEFLFVSLCCEDRKSISAW